MPEVERAEARTDGTNAERSAVVTGGGSGIGASVVELLTGDGWSVTLFDAAVEESTSPRLDALRVDVTDAAAVEKGFRHAESRFGGVDAVVCCAGMSLRGTVAETTDEEAARLMAVNVGGILGTARAALPLLRRRGGGSIVTVASQLGVVPAQGAAAYCASKAAVIMLTKAMALDHGPEGIRVNCVCPGATLTPMLERYFGESPNGAAERTQYQAQQLHGRMVLPEEIAGAVGYLLSDIASSTMGSILVVDGGYVLGGSR